MATSDVIKWGAIGVGLYALYRWIEPGGTNPVSCLFKKVGQAVCSGETALACSIVKWTTCACMTLNGNVEFPNGSQVSMNSLPMGHDCAGNVFVQYSGGVYQLSGSNSCGNWQATQIS